MFIDLKQISVSYSGSTPILDNIDLQIDQGEFIGIAGRAGSGKTTLIETIGGLHKPNSGKVLFRGKDIYQSDFDRLNFRRKLQIVFQFPENQFFETDVWKETAFGPKMLKLSQDEINTRVAKALQSVGLSDEKYLGMSPFSLSGGQKRRLALACALSVQPETLLLDEPFSGLDAEGQERMAKSLVQLNQKGMTILMVSHDPDILCEISNRIIVLGNGKIVSDSNPYDIYMDTKTCSKFGIGQPETKITADLINLPLKDFHYSTFIRELEERIIGGRS